MLHSASDSHILFAERQCFIFLLAFFPLSIGIVLMLAHVFSAFVEVGYVIHIFFFIALTMSVSTESVCVGVLFPNPLSMELQVYQHMFTELQEHARIMKNRYQD